MTYRPYHSYFSLGSQFPMKQDELCISSALEGVSRGSYDVKPSVNYKQSFRYYFPYLYTKLFLYLQDNFLHKLMINHFSLWIISFKFKLPLNPTYFLDVEPFLWFIQFYLVEINRTSCHHPIFNIGIKIWAHEPTPRKMTRWMFYYSSELKFFK